MWTKVTGLPWVNGPNRTITGSSAAPNFTGFGGDSRGYGSSELDLSSLAGQNVRVSFRVEGDDDGSMYGWWIDDIRLYSCADDVPGKPTITKHAATLTSATVTWNPGYAGSGVASYKVTSSDGQTQTLPSTARSATVTGSRHDRTPDRLGRCGQRRGPGRPGDEQHLLPDHDHDIDLDHARHEGTHLHRHRQGDPRGTSTVVASMPVSLQRRMWGKTTWSSLSTGTTTSKGTKVWSVTHYSKATYRVVSKGVTVSLGSTGNSQVVGTR